MHNPLDQFRIYSLINLPKLFGLNIDFSNSALFMCLSILFTGALLLISTHKCQFIPNKKQAVVEMLYSFTEKTMLSVAGESAMAFFPFIFTLFLYILTCNIVGLMPYGFTVTSHIIVTFALGAMVVVFVTIVGIYKHGIGFIKIFNPPGTPSWLIPLMVIIEIITYLSRAATLAIRLGANMIAGHTMLKVIAIFIAQLSIFFAVIPFTFLITLHLLELFVAALQAYIFAILTCVYLDSVINLH
ncbi:ATP synthase subunit a [Candidatus Xenohaliotis californiensis]|uniref:ATP synthase subunit a n=1 Tax=Candidatus Xenohaliotis californiensis TaxID=84677 RepID=A0ABP0EUK0_9RICK|nr:ATP synthase subunit a [Candidatus Xenohaliotis californiensis]